MSAINVTNIAKHGKEYNSAKQYLEGLPLEFFNSNRGVYVAVVPVRIGESLEPRVVSSDPNPTELISRVTEEYMMNSKWILVGKIDGKKVDYKLPSSVPRDLAALVQAPSSERARVAATWRHKRDFGKRNITL